MADLKLKDLKYLVALADTGHFGRAAERCFVSQPTLIPTVGPYLLPRVMSALRKALPRLTLLLYEYQTALLLDRLRAGDIDVGILALPVELDGLDGKALYEEPLALPQHHRLAGRPCRQRPEGNPAAALNRDASKAAREPRGA
ncbi:MAG: LysR substrate-binding domain-containing protein [Steroidobacteraceae bacterium]